MRFMRPSRVIIGAWLLAVAGFPASVAYAQNPSAGLVERLDPTVRGIHSGGPALAMARPSRQPLRTDNPKSDRDPSVSLSVEFVSGSAELTPAAKSTLDELGRALSSPRLARYRFRIEGHTDTVGNPEENRTLSQRRADAVVDYLAEKYRVDKNRLEPVGMGEEGLLVQTPPQTPQPHNRRVTVTNLGT